ncbi:hypothetical protein ORD22_08000 [Sporosarcina sp. GW1-11]|uniref:hypothetical protein n=1 Tax=Sporosarcina sp. GW1-11 TaxID=2899126 RepID=UPI00294D0134|nr:hypothetical protein [Sporosarcina sp. GW1-11]MDV6378189.1 hypothetical protein [Sporosarcina sp. GW1-11]
MNNVDIPNADRPKGLQGLLDKELMKLEKISLDDSASDAVEPSEAVELQQKELVAYSNFETLGELLDSDLLAASIKEEIAGLTFDGAVGQVDLARRAVEMFNLVDHLRMTLEESDSENYLQVKSVVSHSLALLREMGIHEVDVYGQYVDEEYMELLGTIPAEEAPEGLETYQVAVVYRRAFTFEGTGKIIQEALVKTVS